MVSDGSQCMYGLVVGTLADQMDQGQINNRDVISITNYKIVKKDEKEVCIFNEGNIVANMSNIIGDPQIIYGTAGKKIKATMNNIRDLNMCVKGWSLTAACVRKNNIKNFKTEDNEGYLFSVALMDSNDETVKKT